MRYKLQAISVHLIDGCTVIASANVLLLELLEPFYVAYV
jgi:hypothetical protein